MADVTDTLEESISFRKALFNSLQLPDCLLKLIVEFDVELVHYHTDADVDICPDEQFY